MAHYKRKSEPRCACCGRPGGDRHRESCPQFACTRCGAARWVYRPCRGCQMTAREQITAAKERLKRTESTDDQWER